MAKTTLIHIENHALPGAPALSLRQVRGVALLRLLFVVLWLLVGNTLTCYAAKPLSVLVLPPENKTGLATLDWLSLGIQDSITVDLWSIPTVKTQPLTEYGAMRGFDIKQLTVGTMAQALDIGRQAQVDQVWFGEYSRSGPDGLELQYRVLDVSEKKVLHQEKQQGAMASVTAQLATLTVKLLSDAGTNATPEQLRRVGIAKTGSAAAFEQNARAFALQVQMFAKKGHKYQERTGWAERGRRAVTFDPAYAEAHVNLGWAYFTDQNYTAAQTSFETATRLKPYLLDGWMGLGYVHRQLGNRGLATEAFQKAANLNQSLEWPRKELQSILANAPKRQPQQAPPVASSDRRMKAFLASLSADEKVLLEQARNDSPAVSLNAIKALAAAKGETALPFLEEMINWKEQAFEVLKVMVDISVPNSAPYLAEALEKRAHPDESRLSGLNEEKILGVLQLINRRSLLQTAPEVKALLKDPSPAIRERAALVLGDFGKPDALEPLRTMVVVEKSRLARISAQVALVSLGDKQARQQLEALFKAGEDLPAINHAIKLLKQRKLNLNRD